MLWMTWVTLRIPNTQSATGILYAATILVFIGELTAQILSDTGLYPLWWPSADWLDYLLVSRIDTGIVMNITAICQNCENVFRAPLTDTSDGVNCPHCDHRHVVPTGAVVPHDEGVTITRCVVCPSRELYLRKAFSQRLGLAIIATGFILSSIAWANHHIWWCYYGSRFCQSRLSDWFW